MKRSVALGHCICCDVRLACPCEPFTSKDICHCAGEQPPAGTLTATIPSYLSARSARPWYKRILTDWLRQSILVVFLVLMVIASRPFCRRFCPLGAIYALTAPLAASRLSLKPDACIECGRSDKVCPMDLDVRKQVGGADCIACGDCIKACPASGIHRHFGL